MGKAPKKHPYNEWSPSARALDVLGDKWTLLIIRILIGGPVRFVEIERRLPGICTEQLRVRLKQMTDDGLIIRERFREVPPRVQYSLSDRGRAAIPVLDALAEWGTRWERESRRPEETVNIEALLLDKIAVRQLPGFCLWQVLLEVVDGPTTRRFLVCAHHGEIEFTNADEISDQVKVDVSGTAEEWIRFFETGDDLGLQVMSDDAKTLLITCFSSWPTESQASA
jgi:DNA-binding HxlR family transcriptional regulator